MILVLFTNLYPYVVGGEQNFLDIEVRELIKSFERVIVVPANREEKESSRVDGVEVEDSYFDYLRAQNPWSTFLQGLFSSLVYEELLTRPSLFLKPRYLKRLIFSAGFAETARRWVIDWIRKNNVYPGSCLFYTYWFTQEAMGIGLAKRTYPDLKLVARAHGYDLYEERQSPPYWPCRRFALQAVESLFPDSDAGREYLIRRYPAFASKIKTARLGISDSGVVASPSLDGVRRVVSCSRMVPVKRLDLILDGIICAAKKRPSQNVEWHHFGTGPLLDELQKASQETPSNVSVTFHGYSTQAELFQYYRDTPVDVFINLSSSEGTSVAIMEAISCGIPVVATAVGGNLEIVSEKNGVLVSANPSTDEIANALFSCWDDGGNKRKASRTLWLKRYDASRNYAEFTKTLLAIRKLN